MRAGTHSNHITKTVSIVISIVCSWIELFCFWLFTALKKPIAGMDSTDSGTSKWLGNFFGYHTVCTMEIFSSHLWICDFWMSFLNTWFHTKKNVRLNLIHHKLGKWNTSQAGTVEIRFSAMRSPRFWVSGYCTKWRIQANFDSSYSHSLNIKT